MAKLNRERKLIEKRHAKQIRKDARRQAAADGTPSYEMNVDEPAGDDAAELAAGAQHGD